MEKYRQASKLLAPLLTKSSVGLKTLAFGGKGPGPNPAVYAMVCQTLEHKKLIDTVLAKVNKQHGSSNVLSSIKDVATQYILLFELLLGPEQKIKGGGGVKRAIVKYENDFRIALAEEIKQNPIAEHVPTGHWPSYVRINTLLATCTAAHASAIERYSADHVSLHPVVDNLLVLHPESAKTLHDWDVIKSGAGVIQDLSSCLTAVALGGGNGGRWWDRKLAKKAGALPTFLDACAAPGNKTSHLAAIVNGGSNKVNVMGLDRDSKRVKILAKRTELLAPGGQVTPAHRDFLKTEPGDDEFKTLKGILLDPSCSGSGIVSQPDRMGNDDDESEDAR